MKHLLLIATLIFGYPLISQNAAVNSPARIEDPSMGRVRELEKVFLEFVSVLHGPDVDKSRKYLSEGVLSQVSTENLKALSKSIKTDKKIIVLSDKLEYDIGRTGLELVQFKYEDEPFPYEIFQIAFDKTNKIALINSSRPNKMENKN